MSKTVHIKLTHASALDAWEPRDGQAILTCSILIRSGAYEAWEPRTYEFNRVQAGWIIDTGPGYLRRSSWSDVIDWLRYMQPANIELVTTV